MSMENNEQKDQKELQQINKTGLAAT
jgi:hypothetical protein